MTKLLKLAAAAAVSATMTTGVAAAASGSINNGNGADSHNTVRNHSSLDVNVRQHNSAAAVNFNGQLAGSGSAKAYKNTTVGNVGSGRPASSTSWRIWSRHNSSTSRSTPQCPANAISTSVTNRPPSERS